MQGHLLTVTKNPKKYRKFLERDRKKRSTASFLSNHASREIAGELFCKAVNLEETPSRKEECKELYQKCVELDPGHAAAWVNLGTIYYNQWNLDEAERCYKGALAVSPNYSLAHFDLGNVYDDTGRLELAVCEYKTAISLVGERVADSHYNLALVLERMHKHLEAVQHWRAYLKFDSNGAWANFARDQIERTLSRIKGERKFELIS